MHQNWHVSGLAERHLPWRSVEDHSDGAVSRLRADASVRRSNVNLGIDQARDRSNHEIHIPPQKHGIEFALRGSEPRATSPTRLNC
jgi:hypothetical protein